MYVKVAHKTFETINDKKAFSICIYIGKKHVAFTGGKVAKSNKYSISILMFIVFITAFVVSQQLMTFFRWSGKVL